MPTAPGRGGAETELRPHLIKAAAVLEPWGLGSQCTVLSLFLPEAQCPQPPRPTPHGQPELPLLVGRRREASDWQLSGRSLPGSSVQPPPPTPQPRVACQRRPPELTRGAAAAGGRPGMPVL